MKGEDKSDSTPCILIVEDNEQTAELIEAHIKQINYRVVGKVPDGEEAVRKAGETEPDLVLMDIQLEGEMDGIEAADQIRSRFDIPVVFLTGHADSEVLERAKKTEPYGYLGKPATISELRSTLEIALFKHEADRRVRESEKRFRDFLDNLGDAAYETDLSGNITYANSMAEVMAGLPLKDIIGKPFLPALTEESQRLGNDVFQRTLNGERPEYELTFTNGITCAFKNEPLRDENGNIVGVFGIARDVTERKRAEEAIRASEEKFRELAEMLPQFVYEANLDGKFTFLNRAALEATGYNLDDLYDGVNAHDMFVPENQEAAAKSIAEVLEGITLKGGELTVKRKDGTTFPSVSYSGPIFRDDRVVGFRGICVDITESKRSEERQAQLVEEIRHFAYFVSHDLNAPLVALKGFARELKAGMEVIRPVVESALPSLDEEEQSRVKSVLEEDVNESLHFIDSSVNRMAQLIDSILALSRTGRRELRFERLDMNELVRDTLNTLNHKISERGVRVTVGELPYTVADRTSMDQIMANLLGNAVKYLEPGRPGEIEITGHQFPDENVFVVRDNGRGIDQSDASRVFQVFQRVGSQDLPGEGMGLAHVRTLVRRHGGSIWCESVPGAGSTFTFTISSCGLQETNKS